MNIINKRRKKRKRRKEKKEKKTFVCKLKDSQFKNAQQQTGKTDPPKNCSAKYDIFIEARC